MGVIVYVILFIYSVLLTFEFFQQKTVLGSCRFQRPPRITGEFCQLHTAHFLNPYNVVVIVALCEVHIHRSTPYESCWFMLNESGFNKILVN